MRKKCTILKAIALAGVFSLLVGSSSMASPYTVTKGDNLWKIAREQLGDGTRYSEIFEANKDQITDPAKIQIGQVLEIPEGQTGPATNLTSDNTEKDVVNQESQENTTKVDYIVKNASIYTSDADNLRPQAFAVKDGKFVYVGDEAGLADYEGEVKDMQGRFIIPGLMDAHVHVPLSIAMTVRGEMTIIDAGNKTEAFDFIKDYIAKNPGQDAYNFRLDKMKLGNEDICYEELDEITSDAEIYIQEMAGHSVWVNGPVLKKFGIDDNFVDPTPNLHFAVRDEKGHITGCMFEGCASTVLKQSYDSVTDEYIEEQLQTWIDYCKRVGISSVFDAGTPGAEEFAGRAYRKLCEMDKEGKLPVFVEGSYVVFMPDMLDGAIDKLTQWNKEYASEHVRVRTLKIVLDGTTNIETAYMVDPYVSGKNGGRIFDEKTISELIIKLNGLGFDLHVHTVGDGASKTILDAVELAKKELGDNYHTKVTTAHNEILHDSSINRYAKLGVAANFTPFWHGSYDTRPLGEDRINKVFRSRSVYDTGAVFTCSSDNILFGDFSLWNPLLGIEVGITRFFDTNTKIPEHYLTGEPLAPSTECMTMEQMLAGYTINNAYQLNMEDKKGSIEVGKDADFLVYEEDFFKRKASGLSQLEPVEVYFAGESM